MKICVVGGIFDAPPAYQARHVITPETTLVDGLKKAGMDVDAVGHGRFTPSDDYDIIHVHHLGKAALTMAARNSRARFVFTSHEGALLTGYERSLARKTAFRYVLGRADALVALSQQEARYLETVTPSSRVCVIPNGIPTGFFPLVSEPPETRQRQPCQEPYQILFVGQLIELKGIDVLLEAFQKLQQAWRVRLRLVYHNSRLEAHYQRRVTELGIADRVDFIGPLASSRLAEQYRSADLVVLPSWAEALPSVVTEALLCGRPVVASAVGGIPEQVGPYGRVVPPGKAEELVAALDDVLRDLPRFQALAGDMRRHAAAKFNVERMVHSHRTLYEQLLHGLNGAKRRRGAWFDPVVRLAMGVYWARKRRARRAAGAMSRTEPS